VTTLSPGQTGTLPLRGREKMKGFGNKNGI